MTEAKCQHRPDLGSASSAASIAAALVGRCRAISPGTATRAAVRTLRGAATSFGLSSADETLRVLATSTNKRTGLSIPPKITLGSALDAVLHPRWFMDLIKGPPVAFRNFLGIAEGDDTLSHSAFINRHLINPSANWQDLQWVRELWKGPLLVKGITTPEDALKAADSGVDGIIVSNHGGRQLDGVPSAIRVLPRIFDAVGNRVDLILDSGVRRGADVVKAMALGARAVMTGRSWIWGLAAAGQCGVERVQAILAQEIDQTLALLGRSSLEEIDRSVVEVPASWESP